jgi:cobalt-zinc-cadmium efflux system membrane fusion protein
MTALARVSRVLPTVLTFAVLVTVGWWGHHTGWAAPHRSAGHATTGAEAVHWCPEHNVPEADCMLCKKPLAKAMASKEPPAQHREDELVRFAQVASADVFVKANITTQPATLSAISPTIQATAEIAFDPTRVARLSARLSGVVLQVQKRLGDHVSAGDVVMVIEAAEVGKAKSELMKGLADQSAAQAVAVRVRASTKAGFRTTAELQEAEARLRSAEVAMFDAEQALLNLGLPVSVKQLVELEPEDLAAALRKLGLPQSITAESTSANLLPICAPRAGVITDLNVAPGETVEPGASIAVIADATELLLTIHVTPEVARQLKVDQAVRFASQDGVTTSGKLSVVAAAIDDTTRLVPVRAVVANPEGTIRAHQFGTATITVGEEVQATVVPPEAVQYDGPTAYVFVRRTPAIFRALPVRIVSHSSAGIAVDRVLAGDEVAVTGTEMLKGLSFQDKMGAGCTDD